MMFKLKIKIFIHLQITINPLDINVNNIFSTTYILQKKKKKLGNGFVLPFLQMSLMSGLIVDSYFCFCIQSVALSQGCVISEKFH